MDQLLDRPGDSNHTFHPLFVYSLIGPCLMQRMRERHKDKSEWGHSGVTRAAGPGGCVADLSKAARSSLTTHAPFPAVQTTVADRFAVGSSSASSPNVPGGLSDPTSTCATARVSQRQPRRSTSDCSEGEQGRGAGGSIGRRTGGRQGTHASLWSGNGFRERVHQSNNRSQQGARSNGQQSDARPGRQTTKQSQGQQSQEHFGGRQA